MATGGARYTTVSSEKWEDEWYLGLTPQQRNLFDFLVEGSHGTYAGVFRLDSGTPRQKTGPWRAGTWEGALDAMQGHVIRYPGNWWFVVNYLRWNGPRPGTKLAPNQAFGIAEIVMAAPEECRRHFVSRYRPLLKGFSTPLDSVQDPLPIPGHTIPGHTIPGQDTSCASKRPPHASRKLTDAQNDWKQARLAKWDECRKRYYAPKDADWKTVKVRWADSGHAVRLFSDLARDKSFLDGEGGTDQGSRVDRAIWLFFKWRSDFREAKRQDAKAAGKQPPPVAVAVRVFAAQFDEFYDQALEAGA